jgi:hypothetical protein
VRGGEAEERKRRAGRRASEPARARGAREAPGPGAGGAPDGEHRRRPVRGAQQADERDAAEGCAGEIDRVEHAHLPREAREREADGDAGTDEGHGQDDIGERDEGDERRLAVLVEGGEDVHEERPNGREAEQQRGERHLVLRAFRREAMRREVDDERAQRDAEHRERDRQEGKVVPHRHAEDAREEDLQDQRAKRDEEEPCEGVAGGPRCRGSIHGMKAPFTSAGALVKGSAGFSTSISPFGNCHGAASSTSNAPLLFSSAETPSSRIYIEWHPNSNPRISCVSAVSDK